MNFQNLLNQFTGSGIQNTAAKGHQTASGKMSSMLAGGAAGGIMGLLAGSKSSKKFAKKAAVVGGSALIGGIAFKAYKNWQKNNGLNPNTNSQQQSFENSTMQQSLNSQEFQLTLIKSMIAAAKSDGHIDANEQQAIFDAVEKMNLDNQTKGMVFDLLRQPIYIQELVHAAPSLEQKTQVFLASCLAIELDTQSEQAYLDQLSLALKLPADLVEQIKAQAGYAIDDRKMALN